MKASNHTITQSRKLRRVRARGLQDRASRVPRPGAFTYDVRYKSGFTLIEIMIVVAIIGMLASVAIPSFKRSRDSAQQVTCVQNLRAIEGAIECWALETKKESGATVTYRDIGQYLKSNVVCPSGGKTFEDSYRITCVDAQPACLRVPSGQFAHVLQ